MTADESKRMAEDCLKQTGDLLGRHRYRIAGSPECREAAKDIASVFSASCDAVAMEPFTLRPRALWYVGKVMSIVYAGAALGAFLGGWLIYAAWLACLAGLGYGVFQYVFYGNLLDPLFAKGTGINVVGSMEPSGPVRRQILVVGHHDSPYIFSFQERAPSLAFLRLLFSMAAYLALCAIVTSLAVGELIHGGQVRLEGAGLWVVLAGAPFAFQLFFFISKRPSPGAGDNLNSTSMAATIARYLKAERKEGRWLERTRLVLLSTDGEEIGQNGAKEYVRAHRAEMERIPTYVVNIDSVYSEKFLTVLTRDRNSTLPLSAEMAQDLVSLARKLGIGLKSAPLPFGGGGTDAAPFAGAGISTSSIIGLSTGLFNGERLYHTSRDDVGSIEPGAVAKLFHLVTAYIRFIDGKPDPDSDQSSAA